MLVRTLVYSKQGKQSTWKYDVIKAWLQFVWKGENLQIFRHFLMTNQNSLQEEIKCRLKVGNYLVQTLLSSRLLSDNFRIIIYKTIIFPVVLYGCEAWSLTSREKRRLRVFENRILRRIFEPKRDENGGWKRFHYGELHGIYRLPNI